MMDPEDGSAMIVALPIVIVAGVEATGGTKTAEG
jgi:hypothetical protein